MTVESKKENIVSILNNNNMVTKIPFFPGMSGTCFDPNEALYNELSYPENKVFYLAKYGDDVDLENEIEIDFDRYEKTIGERFISLLTENSIPSWIEKMVYSHISISCNYSNGDLYVNIIYSEDMFEKIIDFLTNNKEYCEKRIYEIFQENYENYFDNPNMKDIEYWFDFFKNPSYNKTSCESVSNSEFYLILSTLIQLWYEINFDKNNSVLGYGEFPGNVVCWTLEDLYTGEFLYYEKKKWISEDDRKELLEKNKKLIAENYSDYKRYKESFNK